MQLCLPHRNHNWELPSHIECAEWSRCSLMVCGHCTQPWAVMQHWECPVPGEAGLLLLGALLLGFEGTQNIGENSPLERTHFSEFLEDTDVVLLAGSCSAGELWIVAGQTGQLCWMSWGIQVLFVGVTSSPFFWVRSWMWGHLTLWIWYPNQTKDVLVLQAFDCCFIRNRKLICSDQKAFGLNTKQLWCFSWVLLSSSLTRDSSSGGGMQLQTPIVVLLEVFLCAYL